MNTPEQQPSEQQGDSGRERQEQRKAPGRPFTPGDPRINRQGRPKAGALPEGGEEAAPPGDFDLLSQMEAMLQRPKSQDRGEAQKGLREWRDADLKGFMGKLADLKGKAMAAEAKAKPDVTSGR